jgi:hypothetical protein
MTSSCEGSEERLHRIAAYWRDHPGASSREVANALGLVVWEVANAKHRILQGEVVPPRPSVPRSRPQTPEEIRQQWRHDLAVTDGFRRPLRYQGEA